MVAKSRPIEGTVISAGFQTHGVGQYGSTWISSSGQNALFSIVLYPTFLPVSEFFLLSMAMSLGLMEGVHSLGLTARFQLKWPNDLYVNGNKTGGILIQNSISHKQIEASVIGFGINLNQTEFPPELPQATSLVNATGRPIPPIDFIDTLLPYLDKYYKSLMLQRDKERLFEQWLPIYLQQLYLYQQWHDFRLPDGAIFTGKILGIDFVGKLMVLSKNDGQIHLFMVKEVIF